MTPEDEYLFVYWVNRSPSQRGAYKAVDRAGFVAGTAKYDPALSAIPLTVRATASRWRLVAAVASILFVVGIGSATLTQFLIGDREQSVQAFQTETGQRTTITLPDGSLVTLDSETDMRFTDMPGERPVDLLTGRAFFKVAHKPSRPFPVTAAGKRVRTQ